MEQDTEKYKDLGGRLAYAMCGLSTAEAITHKAATEHAAEDDVTKKMVCKLAADIYEAADRTNCPEFFVFRKLANAQEWPEPLESYYDSVLAGLGNVMLREGHKSAEQKKTAAARGLAGLLPSLVSRGLSVTPSMITALAGLGVGAGAGVGALSWRMNRDADKDKAELEAMKARIKYYNEITDEISKDLQDKGIVEETDLDQYEQARD